jgi:methylphosphotriester-DNA--protein-cysteine methyltransferase
MKRILRTYLLSLAVVSCSQPSEHQATDADRRLWQSYLERAALHPDSTILLADSALQLARTRGMSDTGTYLPLELKSLAERKAGRYSEARSWLDSIKFLAAEAGHDGVEARALNGIGDILLQTPDWMMAEAPLRDALELTETSGLTGEKPYILFTLSSWLRKNGNPTAAMDTLELAEQLFRAAGNRRFLGHVYLAKGAIDLDRRDSIQAEADLRTSLADYGAMGDTIYMSRSYRSLSAILLARYPDSALWYFNAAIQADPSHQFHNSYLAGLMLFAKHHMEAGRTEKAMPFLDSAVRFATSTKNHNATWKAWLQLGVARLQQNDPDMSDSAFLKALAVSMGNGQFSEFKQSLAFWQEKFKKQGELQDADRIGSWADPKRFVASGDIPVAQPKQVTEISPSRRAAIQKEQRMRMAIAASSLLLLLLGIWRIRVMRRNREFTAYREQAEKLAAARTYRRVTIARAPQDVNPDGTQMVMDQEKRVMALEMLFEREKLHLDPNLNFSAVCDRLSEPEAPFRAVVKKMYDMEFEEWLQYARVEEAIQAIARGENLKMVHSMCGFADATGFRKIFQKITGLPPGLYMKWPKPPIR